MMVEGTTRATLDTLPRTSFLGMKSDAIVFVFCSMTYNDKNQVKTLSFLPVFTSTSYMYLSGFDI